MLSRTSSDALLARLVDREGPAGPAQFIRLRWVAVAGAAAAGAAGWLLLGLRFRVAPVAGLLAAIAGYNLAYRMVLGRVGRIAPSRLRLFAISQVVLDFLALTLLAWLTAGAASPVSIYFVFHTAIAGIALSGRQSLALTTVGFGLFALMAVLGQAGLIPSFPLTGPGVTMSVMGGARDLVVRLFVLGTTLYIVRYFAAALSGRLTARTAEVAAANERLRQADRERLRAIVTVTHELRAPSAAAESLLDVVVAGHLNRGCEKCEARPLLERARDRVRGLRKMTDDLLDLHQLELGELTIVPARFLLAPVIAEVFEHLAGLAQERGVTMTADGLKALPALMGDERSVRFVAGNLVSNAVKYNVPGGRVTVSAEREDGLVRIRVRDTGVGIPADEMPKVFDVFYRGSYARTTRRLGTGLGLSLVKRLVNAQGGTVGVESVAGTGSTFWFTLPVAGG